MNLDLMDFGNLSLRPGGGATKLNKVQKGTLGSQTQEGGKPIIHQSPAQKELQQSTKERVKYSQDILLRYAEGNTYLPPGLQDSACELLVKNNEGIDQPHVDATLDGDSKQSDQRDWRSRTDEDKDDPLLQRAEDVGQIAWRPQKGGLPIEEQAIRTVKGILNKLTPENFDRMTLQLLEVLKQKNVLQQAIEYLFNKATGEPQFGPLYAELCFQIDRYLVVWEQKGQYMLLENDPVQADRFNQQQQHLQKKQKSQFKKILLNTCQEEYKKVFQQRNEIYKQKPVNEDYDEEILYEDRVIQAKKRTVNIVKLISELFMKNMLPERVLHFLIQELLQNYQVSVSQDKQIDVNEDNVEAVCQVVTVAGLKLSQSIVKKQIDQYLSQLQAIQQDGGVSSRIKFMIQDVIDLKGKNWQTRRQTYTAQKIDDLRREAQIELNFQMPMQQKQQLYPSYTKSNQANRSLNEDELIPKFGDEVIDQSTHISPPSFQKIPQQNGHLPLSQTTLQQSKPEQQQKVTQPKDLQQQKLSQAKDQQQQKPKDQQPNLDEATLNKKTKAAFEEYIEIQNKDEFNLCMQELGSPAFMDRVVCLGVEAMYDMTSSKDPQVIIDLLIYLLDQNIVSQDQLVQALTDMRERLSDDRSDYPYSLSRLGLLFVQLNKQNKLSSDKLHEIANKQEDVEDDNTLEEFQKELQKGLK